MTDIRLALLARLMEDTARRLDADCLALALPCHLPGRLRVFARGADFPDPPEFVPVAARDSLCHQVMHSGRDLRSALAGRDGPSAGRRCGMMIAEELVSYCGTPVRSDDGAAIRASLSASTRLPRIWSRSDMARLRALSAQISALRLLPPPCRLPDRIGGASR
ncbi:GAF domain-containing protein [Mangrovicoccus algicola]|uniref:GAF domain-containing protein n=1 Tax=Mangrovicoccus algicola TaxID=2771008 RepID=A0A8J6YV13_9RHOB|nr:GAF domain-containing protein [Mangrovicoccus algicola]MBE3639768.1 GAF domain-containing protein [Mangrovicoccus algicola]